MDQHLLFQRLEFVAPALGQLLGQQINDIALAFIVLTLFLVSFAGSIIATLRGILPERDLQVLGGISMALAIFPDLALFLILYLMLPHGISTWCEILPGAIAADLLLELAKKAFLYFFSTYISTSNLIYGLVAAIIAFLTWAYLRVHIFLYGAYLSAYYYRLKQMKRRET